MQSLRRNHHAESGMVEPRRNELRASRSGSRGHESGSSADESSDRHESFLPGRKTSQLCPTTSLRKRGVDAVKIVWLCAATNSGMENVAHADQYHAIASKFAPIALDLMKKNEFGEREHEETLLKRVALLWKSIVVNDATVCCKDLKEVRNFRPLFDFDALQVLLNAGAHRANSQDTLSEIFLAAAGVVLPIPSELIDLRVIAESIHLYIEKCTSVETIDNFVFFLYQLYSRPEVRAQIYTCLRCGEIVSKLKHSLQNKQKSSEMLPHFERASLHFEKTERDQMVDSIKQRFSAVNIPLSSILLDALVRSNIDGETLTTLNKNDLPLLNFDFKQKKELEKYIDRRDASATSSSSYS